LSSPKKHNQTKQTYEFVYLSAFILIVSLDFISKWATAHYLPEVNSSHFWYPYGGKAIFYNFYGVNFSLVHAINRGAAWGVLASYQTWLTYGRIGLIAILSTYLLFYNQKRKDTLPLVFILSGAVGNVIDTFLYGHVIDMFKFDLWGYSYPVFNVADSFILLGVMGLFFSNFTESLNERKNP